MIKNNRLPGVNQNHDHIREDWQQENIRLRAGAGSALDKYRHLTHKTGYGNDSNKLPVKKSYVNRVITAQDYSPVFIDTTLDRRYEMGSRQQSNGMRAREVFNKFLNPPSKFIDEVADYLHTDVESAFVITCAVFQAMRDGVDPRFAVFFGQSLPLLLRGMFFEDFNLSSVPRVIRQKNEFIQFIQSKIPSKQRKNFHDPREVIMSLRAVFRVLEKNMTRNAINEMKRLLHSEIVELIDSPQYEYNFKHI